MVYSSSPVWRGGFLKIISEKTVYDGKFISVSEIDFVGRGGQSGAWEIVRRKTFGKIVSVFALTKNREVILEKIFRIPMGTYVFELPAGLMNKPDEKQEEAIKRELREETGYVAESVELMLEGPFNAGLLNDEIMIFFANDVEKVGEPQLEHAEDIEVVLVPLDDLIDFALNPPGGCGIDVKILSIVPILQKRGLI